MFKMTRGQFGDILSAGTQTRTIYDERLHDTDYMNQEITDKWLVTFVTVDPTTAIMYIECAPRKAVKEWEGK